MIWFIFLRFEKILFFHKNILNLATVDCWSCFVHKLHYQTWERSNVCTELHPVISFSRSNQFLFINEVVVSSNNLDFFFFKCLSIIIWSHFSVELLLSLPCRVWFNLKIFIFLIFFPNSQSIIFGVYLLQANKIVVVEVLLYWKLVLAFKNLLRFQWFLMICVCIIKIWLGNDVSFIKI